MDSWGNVAGRAWGRWCTTTSAQSVAVAVASQLGITPSKVGGGSQSVVDHIALVFKLTRHNSLGRYTVSVPGR